MLVTTDGLLLEDQNRVSPLVLLQYRVGGNDKVMHTCTHSYDIHVLNIPCPTSMLALCYSEGMKEKA